MEPRPANDVVLEMMKPCDLGSCNEVLSAKQIILPQTSVAVQMSFSILNVSVAFSFQIRGESQTKILTCADGCVETNQVRSQLGVTSNRSKALERQLPLRSFLERTDGCTVANHIWLHGDLGKL